MTYEEVAALAFDHEDMVARRGNSTLCCERTGSSVIGMLNHKVIHRAAAAVSLAALLTLSACGASSSRGTQDSPHDAGDNSPAHIINMPNGYMNLAFKCNGTDGLYAHTRAAAPVVVPNDSNCTGKG